MRRGRSGEFRIIAGAWRGRRLGFPDAGGVRPTADRVRETLFNWLGPSIPGDRFLDLFAGSGALGLEALSRGAQGGVFVDRERRLTARIEQHLEELGPDAETRVVTAELPAWLRRETPAAASLVFLDPPWKARLHGRVLTVLEENGWLAPGARVYLEWPARSGAPALPEHWSWLRQGRAGEAGLGLATAPS